ncbi:glycogen operon protein [Mumia flava]|uniref:Glycogen operon protein n=1 Tax=Mumia flava TaxID=1348852 RepID=A0A2M9B894_9ACTN|nr:glycogen debranching protein GlgX [Mumia flava]PJJ54162.1 glycogen operon protein [Mumia flava]
MHDSEAWAYERHGSAPGYPHPFGATRLAGGGVNFAVHAPRARAVQVELPGIGTVELESRTGSVWHVEVAGLPPRQEYGFVVDGVRLLDPYARHVTGGLDGHTSALRSYVVEPGFDWAGDVAPRTPWDRTVIYEAHVKGLTRLHPDIPDELRGTYAGLVHPAVLDHLVDLGVTAVELLPVHHFVTEPSVAERGLVNYWGYNTAAYLAPHAPYAATDDPVSEFRTMVRALHERGLEVLLDVVYNHTAEGGKDGPLLHLRALDDAGYYRHAHGRYFDVTGCGNTVRTHAAPAEALVMESLRYWVTEMHVDGFRFDLASALARAGQGRVNLHRSLIERITADPALRGVKLVAEPWDASMDGYLLGGYPEPWAEWNDRFRDDVRDFWRGHGGGAAPIATRLAGSSEIFGPSGRPPQASVNLVTAHDGFTLRDTVSYDHKHNEANGEDNRDGHNHNCSDNGGAEGETDDVEVLTRRRRRSAALLATLLVSAGTPMIRAGDELGQTQGGNNNAYCHDDETTWLPWIPDVGWGHLRTVASRLLALRAEHAALRTARYFTGEPGGPYGREDLAWLHPDARPWTDEDWADDTTTAVGMALDGTQTGDGEGRSVLVLLNAADGPVAWTLPADPWPPSYRVALDTADLDRDATYGAKETIEVAGQSVLVLVEATEI